MNSLPDRRHLVAKANAKSLRICRVSTLGEAKTLEAEWSSDDFTQPGDVRPIQCAPHPHPPLVSYGGPEYPLGPRMPSSINGDT